MGLAVKRKPGSGTGPLPWGRLSKAGKQAFRKRVEPNRRANMLKKGRAEKEEFPQEMLGVYICVF